ncbi:MAG: hypothetical protein OXN91_06490 [Chloroflexota bacterium]|nr:hypothetical protein [Chloroflexota bacterium]
MIDAVVVAHGQADIASRAARSIRSAGRLVQSLTIVDTAGDPAVGGAGADPEAAAPRDYKSLI